MGSRAVTCAVTNVTLCDDEAVLLPLAPAWSQPSKRRFPGYGGEGRAGASLCTTGGASTIFAPLMLPIFGVVGDYERFEFLHEDDHTAWLADRLGHAIDEVQCAVSRGDHLRKVDRFARAAYRAQAWSLFQRTADWGGALYGCWIAREAWDELSVDTWGGDGGRSTSVYASGSFSPYNLRGMGFVAGEPDPESARRLFPEGFATGHHPDRRVVPYRHEGDKPGLSPEEGLVLWDNDGWFRLTLDGKDLGSVHGPRSADSALASAGSGLPEEAVRWAERTPALEGVLREAARSALERVEFQRARRARLESQPWTAFRPLARATPTEQAACDGQKHVVLTRDDPPEFARVEDCPRRPHGGCWRPAQSLDGLPAAALEELARQGWRRRWPNPWLGPHTGNADLHQLAPEMLAIYRRTLFGRFFPRWLALQTFVVNLHATNRILAPAPRGLQYGHNALEQRVASLATRIARRRARRRQP